MKAFLILKEIYDTHSAAADALGQSKQNYYGWRKRNRIPQDYWPQVIAATGGRVSYEDLATKH